MNILLICDIDGTISNVATRFIDIPIPEPKLRSNPEYITYLDHIQTYEKLMSDKPVRGMQKFLSSFNLQFVDIVYLTARDEKYRKTTMEWLNLHNFPIFELYMRPEGDDRPSNLYKENVINTLKHQYSNIILLDDDISMKEMCERNKITFLQAHSGGKVL
jgi:hypothetical protein